MEASQKRRLAPICHQSFMFLFPLAVPSFSRLKPDRPFGFRGRRGRAVDLTHDAEYVSDTFVMFFYLPFDLNQFLRERGVGSKDLPEFCESSHDGDIDLDGLLAFKDARCMAIPCSVKT